MDPRQLQEWSSYLRANQANSQSPEYQTVARAYQKAYGEMERNAANEANYKGVGGVVKASGQGLGAGVIEGTDFLSQALGGRLVRTVQSYLTGEPMKETAGEAMKRNLNVPSAEDVPESVRGWYYGGQATGSALPMAAATIGTAGAAPLVVGAEAGTAAALPLAAQAMRGTALAEGLGAVGAGTGAKVADMAFPDNPIARAVGSIAAPMATAPALSAIQAGGRAAGSTTIGGRVADFMNPERGAARNLGHAIDDAGGDVASLVGQLKDTTGPATVLSGDQTLNDVAAVLKQKNVNFGRTLAQQEDDALGSMAGSLNQTIGGSLPEDLADASRQFSMLAGQRAAGAERGAAQAAQPFKPSYDEITSASEGMHGQLQQVEKKLQDVSNTLWGRIPKTQNIGQTGVTPLLQKVVEHEANAEPYADIMGQTSKALLERMRTGGGLGSVEAGQLLKLRSALTNDIRAQPPLGPNRPGIRAVRQMIDAIDEGLVRANVPYAQEARDFTKRMNDVLSRTAANELRMKEPGTGAFRVDPRLATETLLQGSGSAPRANVEDLGQALGAMNPGGPLAAGPARPGVVPTPPPAEFAPALAKKLGDQVVDQSTGMVKPGPAERVLGTKSELELYPDLQNRLSDAVGASRSAEAARGYADSVAKTTDMIARAVQEKPAELLNKLLDGSTAQPMKALDELFQHAQTTKNGTDGLKAAIGKYLGQDGDPVKAAARLIEPLSEKGDKTLIDWMRTKGLINTTDAAIMRLSAKQITQAGVARGMANARAVDIESKVSDPAKVLAQVVGARLGGQLVPGAGAIQSAGIGSRYANKLLTQTFGGKSQVRVLEDAFTGKNGRSVGGLLENYMKLQGRPVGGGKANAAILPMWARTGPIASGATQAERSQKQETTKRRVYR